MSTERIVVSLEDVAIAAAIQNELANALGENVQLSSSRLIRENTPKTDIIVCGLRGAELNELQRAFSKSNVHPHFILVGNQEQAHWKLWAKSPQIHNAPTGMKQLIQQCQHVLDMPNTSFETGTLLEGYGVVQLLTSLSSAGRTGTLVVRQGQKRGDVHFEKGELVSVLAGSHTGIQALTRICLWETATFELHNEETMAPLVQTLDPTNLKTAIRFLANAKKRLKLSSFGVVFPATSLQLTSAIGKWLVGQSSLSQSYADVLWDSPFDIRETVLAMEQFHAHTSSTHHQVSPMQNEIRLTENDLFDVQDLPKHSPLKGLGVLQVSFSKDEEDFFSEKNQESVWISDDFEDLQKDYAKNSGLWKRFLTNPNEL